MSCADEAVSEVKNLFFSDQLIEENILLDIYTPNSNGVQQIDLKRLNIDRVFSKKQIASKFLFKRVRLVDSVKYQEDYAIKTILEIKNEQKRLGKNFKNYYTLIPSRSFIKRKKEPLLFVQVDEHIFYLINSYLLEELEDKPFSFNAIYNWLIKKISIKTFTK